MKHSELRSTDTATSSILSIVSLSRVGFMPTNLPPPLGIAIFLTGRLNRSGLRSMTFSERRRAKPQINRKTSDCQNGVTQTFGMRC
ncbi:hypothetical protein WN73_38525 [Bradyrhizobium sp. CCBAU 45394]|uniref:hypothetical protein n=1 Tax=Bradyrhizobium sp. CCBAU 45394 TaxID=1325087 RepID=UPI0023028F65|nr:hypothetical protein [Bradyrhizobium sp. CCBAU 45394]MDA9396410.1 hypothetical protein [Bradyrhizobium sp. CCBAU 45394]